MTHCQIRFGYSVDKCRLSCASHTDNSNKNRLIARTARFGGIVPRHGIAFLLLRDRVTFVDHTKFKKDEVRSTYVKSLGAVG
jgi:hypothetical protein